MEREREREGEGEGEGGREGEGEGERDRGGGKHVTGNILEAETTPSAYTCHTDYTCATSV